MTRGSNQRAGTTPWRVRAFNYLAAALRLRRRRRQEPDPDVRPEEPQLTVASVVMTSATVATVAAGPAVRPHLVQARNNAVMVRSGPLAPGVSAIFMGEPSAPPLDPHLNNARNRELEEEAARQDLFSLGGITHPEVLTFGDVRLTRGQLNRCLRLMQDLIDIVRTPSVEGSDAINIRIKGNITDLIKVLTSFTMDPRERYALLRIQPNNDNIFIQSRSANSLQSVTRNNLTGSGSEPPTMRLKEVNQTQIREEACPNSSERKINRTKAMVHFEELQNEDVETNEEPDVEAPEASREEAAHELGAGASYEEGRVDVDLGTFNQQATRLQQAHAQPGEGRCSDELERIFEPRPLRSQTLPTTRSGDASGYFHKDLKKYIGYSSTQVDDCCYGEMQPRAEKRVTPKKGLLAKSAAAISTAAHKLSKTMSCSSEAVKAELFPNPMYTFTKSRRYADYEDEAGPSTRRYYWKREAGAGNDEEQSVNANNKPYLLVNEPDLGVKRKVAPVKPPRSSFRGSTSSRHEAQAPPQTPPPEYSTLPRSNLSIEVTRSSPSPTQTSSEQSEDDLQDAFKLSVVTAETRESSPPLSARSASIRSSFSIKSTRYSPPPTPSELESARMDEFQPNDTGSKFEFPLEGVTRSPSPSPLPPLPSPPITPPAAFRRASRHITQFHSFPNNNIPAAGPMQVLATPIRETAIVGSPPPTPCRTSGSVSTSNSTSTASTYISNSASTSASISISEDEPGSSRPTGSRPAGDLPLQQNPPPEAEGEPLLWMFMDDNILLQHGTIPFPTTYKHPK